jgi:hypothetical protein
LLKRGDKIHLLSNGYRNADAICEKIREIMNGK